MLPLFSTHLGPRLALSYSLALLGCASRDVPTAYPASSPASAHAAPAPLPNVTRALDGDPPLAPVAGDGWIGLDAAQGGSHADHGAHHHHGSPATHKPVQPAAPQAAPGHEHHQGAAPEEKRDAH